VAFKSDSAQRKRTLHLGFRLFRHKQPIAPTFLCMVHGRVGTLQQLFSVVAVLRKNRNSYAGRYLDCVTGNVERAVECLQNFLCNEYGITAHLDFLQDYHKFVSPQSSHGI